MNKYGAIKEKIKQPGVGQPFINVVWTMSILDVVTNQWAVDEEVISPHSGTSLSLCEGIER
jgi:hypothetical protein